MSTDHCPYLWDYRRSQIRVEQYSTAEALDLWDGGGGSALVFRKEDNKVGVFHNRNPSNPD